MQLYTFRHVYNSQEYTIDFRALEWSVDQLFLVTRIEPHFDSVSLPFYYSKTGEPSHFNRDTNDFHKHLFKALKDCQPFD